MGSLSTFQTSALWEVRNRQTMQHKFGTPISLTINSLKKGAPKLTPKRINPHKSNTFQGPCEWYFKFSGSEIWYWPPATLMVQCGVSGKHGPRSTAYARKTCRARARSNSSFLNLYALLGWCPKKGKKHAHMSSKWVTTS